MGNTGLGAFVIMPFDAEFQSVYELLIKRELEQIGYEVNRADDASAQRAIMHDVMSGLVKSDLIVADLTTRNPNVYYELGVAHALQKQVLLLAQDIEEIPFDLRAYRVLIYSTHFAKIEDARTRLRELALLASAGKLLVSNPYSDYMASIGHGAKDANKHVASTLIGKVEISAEREEKGFLDYEVEALESSNSLAEVLHGTNRVITELGTKFNLATADLKKNESQSPAMRREMVRSIAKAIEDSSGQLAEQNAAFRSNIDQLAPALDYLYADASRFPKDKLDGLTELYEVYGQTLKSMSSLRNPTISFIDLLVKTPSVEAKFNRARNFLIQELKTFIQLVDTTEATIVRARNRINEILGHGHENQSQQSPAAP